MSLHDLHKSGDDIIAEGQALKRELDHDAAANVQRLLRFVERYAISGELKDSAALLQLELGTSPRPDTLDIVNRMIALVESIIAEHSAEGAYDNRLQRARLIIEMRERFQRMAQPHDEVFHGTELYKRYADSGFTLGPLSLSLRLGEITGVVGQNAHGKTTLLRIIAGELQADRGEVEYPWLLQGGTHRIDWPSVKRHIAFVPQELPAWQGSLGDTLHYEAALHGLYGQDNERAVSFIIERLGLGRHLDKRWAHLSGGYKVRFALARALVWKPRLLVMDEPLANLDVKAKGVLLQDIRDLAGSYSHPIAVILSSHDLHNLESVCGQMLFLNDGKVRFSGDIRSIGAQRSRNEFEIGTSLPLIELRDRLKETFIQDIREVGLNLLLSTGRQVQSAQVLQLLLERGIDVRYFRDNSTSIRSLFD